MNDDLISRQAAIEVLNKLARDNFTLKDAFAIYLGALHDASDGIKALPSAERIGRWLDRDMSDFMFCSACGDWAGSYARRWSYCPNCGAKMEGE